MKTTRALLWVALCASACGGSAKPAPVVVPPPVVTGAAGDADLRTLVAQVAAAKACSLVEHQFRATQSKDPGRPVTGAVWLRDCQISYDGPRLTLEISGSGWTWAERKQKKIGGTFELHQYVKFELHAHVVGEVDVAYDPLTSVATLWLSPSETPKVSVKTVGDIDIDREGVWSDVIGLVGSAVGQNPDANGRAQAAREGAAETTKQLARGMTVTMNLCNGLSHMMLGRLERGIYGPAGAGETRRQQITIHPGGLLVFAPQAAPSGMSITVDTRGPVRVGLACRDEAEAAAAAFLAGKPPAVKYLTDQVITGEGKLAIAAPHCPVTVIAEAIGPLPVSFDYERPVAEAAHATSGGMIRCDKPAAAPVPEKAEPATDTAPAAAAAP